MPDGRGALWIAGALGLAGLAIAWKPHPQPRLAAPAAPALRQDRIALPAPRSLPGGGEPVRSVLNAPPRMRYGDFVWNDAGVPEGRLWIRVDRAAQIVSVLRGPHEIGTAVILYGAPEKPTPAGSYPILARLRDHRSATYDADMPYTLRLTADGVAIHASDVREGYATHGCVGVPLDFARRLFDAARKGDEVVIV